MKKFLILILLFVGLLNACKDDDCPDSIIIDPSNNEYTVKGKLLNGTTMQPINPGMIIALIAQNNGLEVKREEVAKAKIQSDGSFELKYKHSKIAAISTAFMRFESQFYISKNLPKNQNLDTILYESDMGAVSIFIESIGYSNSDTLYISYPDESEFALFDTLPLPYNAFYKQIRTAVGSSGVAYLINDPIVRYYDSKKNSFSKEVNAQYFNVSGDPFIDTVNLVIKR